jgi:hypothetical protein
LFFVDDSQFLFSLSPRLNSLSTRNQRSQAAVAKLGAVREGVLRRDRLTWTGYIRDTVYFSILAAEWPDVKSRLEQRLAGFL